MRRAFTLAEVLLSLGTLALVLVMGLGVLQYSLQANRRGEHSLRAGYLAREKLTELLRAPLEQLPARGSFSAPWQDYRFAVHTESVAEGLVRLQVQVDGPGGSRVSLANDRRAQPRDLLFCVHDGTRWQLARAHEEGGPRSLLPSTGGNDTQPTVSADGATIVFVSDREGLGLWSIPADGSRPPARLAGAPASATAPSFSPVGRRLACSAPGGNHGAQLFVGELGVSSAQVTHLDAHVSAPGWSPAGDRLAVVLDGTTIDTLDGEVPQALVEAEGWNTSPAYSPDGASVAFMSNREGNPDIYRLHISSGRLDRLTLDPAYDTHPRWSADGGRLVFQSDRGGVQRIWTMNADGSDLRRLGRPEDETMPPGAQPEADPIFLPANASKGGA